MPGYGVVFRLVGGAFVACGLIAWRRRPDSYSGMLMTATGFLLFVEPVFAQFDAGSADVVGYVFGDLWSIPIVWLMLTMLSGGRLATRTDRVLVAVFVVEFFLSLGTVLFIEYEGNFLLVHADEGLADGFETARAMLVSVALIAIAVVIGARWRAASKPRRRAMWPGVAGIVALLSFAVAQQAAPVWLRWFAITSLLLIPAGFLAGLLSSRLARGGLADLFRRLPTHARRGAPARARARARRPQRSRSCAAGPRSRRAARRRRSTTDAALVYDASLDDDPELIEAVASAAGIALESRARLERIVTAGDDERRRLERNLHDGAQQRLVALAMQLRLIQHELHTDPAAANRLVDNASQELAMSLAELRELARGIHPAVLNHGLEPALQTLAGQATVPTEVAYDGGGQAAGAGRAGGLLRDVGGARQRRQVRARDERQDPRRA